MLLLIFVKYKNQEFVINLIIYQMINQIVNKYYNFWLLIIAKQKPRVLHILKSKLIKSLVINNCETKAKSVKCY